MSETFNFNHQFKFIFHTSWMEPCHKCQALNGRVYTDQSLYQHVLYDVIWGNIWDLDNDLPLTHPNCKCYLEVIYESTLEELLNLSEMETFQRGGQTVTVARSTTSGQFTKRNAFKEFGIMTSNIKEMKAELDELNPKLEETKTRIVSTNEQLDILFLMLRRAHLPPDLERAISVALRARGAFIKAGEAGELMNAIAIGALTGPGGWLLMLVKLGIAGTMAYDTAATIMEMGGT